MERYPSWWIRRQYGEDSNAFQLDKQISAMPVKISSALNIEINKLNLKFIWKYKVPRVAKIYFEKDQSWVTPNFQFQNLLQSHNNNESALLA